MKLDWFRHPLFGTVVLAMALLTATFWICGIRDYGLAGALLAGLVCTSSLVAVVAGFFVYVRVVRATLPSWLPSDSTNHWTWNVSILIWLVIAFGILFAAGEWIKKLGPSSSWEANKHVGKVVTVTGSLAQIVQTKNKDIYLNLDAPYPKNAFYALVPSDAPKEVLRLALAWRLRLALDDDRIQGFYVKGRVEQKDSRGRAFIIVRESKQMWIRDFDDEAEEAGLRREESYRGR